MTQTNFKALILKAKNDLACVAKKNKRNFVNISGADFNELFKLKLAQQMRLRRKQNDFILDDNNKNLINQLFYYVVGSPRFCGELEKGLLVVGNLGAGKTMIMQAFCSLWGDLHQIQIKTITAKKYVESLLDPEKFRNTQGSLPNFGVGTIFIDDIAKESKKINIYGTEICPMADLLAERYDRGIITFMTGNYTLETLKSLYGETITDRMKEMFNVIILKGESRRR